MSQNYGETDYSKENGTGSGKVEFLKLSQGEHQLRLISKPYKLQCHPAIKTETEAEAKKGYGRKVPCSAEYTGEGKKPAYVQNSCPLCDKGFKPQTRYMYWVIDRGTGAAKVIDISWQIFSQIKLLANSKIWGPDPQRLDLIIAKNPTSKGPSDFYLVDHGQIEALSVDDQRLRDSADLDYLVEHTKPWTKSAVQKVLDKVLEGDELFIPPPPKPKDDVKPSGKKATTVPPAELVADASNEDIADAFPNYDQQADAAAN